MSKVYRVYSDFIPDERTIFAVNTWHTNNIKNIPVSDKHINRNIDKFPYLKDLFDYAADRCEYDDIIIYTNSDIGLVSDTVNFTDKLFFCPRKQVKETRTYTSEELSHIPYESSINCDCFGFTKRWYIENRNKIPDFVIGCPKWDIAFLILLEGAVRLNNVIFHVEHEPGWKVNNLRESNLYNNFIFNKCLKNNMPSLINEDDSLNKENFFKFMSAKRGFSYMTDVVFISFYTPSHSYLFKKTFLPSFIGTFKDKYLLASKNFNDQICQTGTYHTAGWRLTQIEKFKHIINVVSNLLDEQIFIFCDADIVHLNDYVDIISNELKDCDIVAQDAFSKKKEYGRFCSGFFAGKKSKAVLTFLYNIYDDLLVNSNDDSRGDQFYMNINSILVNIKKLDNSFFSPGAVTSGEIIISEQFDTVIDNLEKTTKMVHANFIVSPQQKLSFLLKTKNKFYA